MNSPSVVAIAVNSTNIYFVRIAYIYYRAFVSIVCNGEVTVSISVRFQLKLVNRFRNKHPILFKSIIICSKNLIIIRFLVCGINIIFIPRCRIGYAITNFSTSITIYIKGINCINFVIGYSKFNYVSAIA